MAKRGSGLREQVRKGGGMKRYRKDGAAREERGTRCRRLMTTSMPTIDCLPPLRRTFPLLSRHSNSIYYPPSCCSASLRCIGGALLAARFLSLFQHVALVDGLINKLNNSKKKLSLSQDLATLDVTKLTPLSPEVISRQATINIGEREKEREHLREREDCVEEESIDLYSFGLSPLDLFLHLSLHLLHLSLHLFHNNRNHRARRPRQVHGRQGHLGRADRPLQERAREEHHHQARVRQRQDL